jgi:GNAT superfamily N-acetyltransferase
LNDVDGAAQPGRSSSCATDVAVRRAVAADASTVAVLSGQFGYPATGEAIGRRLAAIIDDPDATVLVAQARDGAVVGWVHVRTLQLLQRDACAEICGLVVEEAWRYRGIGGQLMAAAEDWARRQGMSLLRLRSNVVRNDAHAFYRRLGYAGSKTSVLFTKTL